MKTGTKKTVTILKGLSNPHRLRVFMLLIRDEFCVCELKEILGIKQSRISHIMSELSHAGLVKSKREGKWVLYSLNPEAEKEAVVRALKKDVSLEDKYLRKMERVKKTSPRAKKCG